MKTHLLLLIMLFLPVGGIQNAVAMDAQYAQSYLDSPSECDQQEKGVPNGMSPQNVVITLGTQVLQSSNTNGHSPYSYTWESRRIQFVYTAAEILAAGGSAGSITAIAWDVAQLNEGDLRNYEIRLAHTTASDASNHNTASLTTVKNAHTLPPGNIGWYTIPFDNPFAWNGTDNLLVDVCWGVNTSFSLTGKVWLYNNVANQKITEHSSTANQCGITTTLRSNGKPRAQLTITPTPSIDPSLVSITSPTSPIWSFNSGIKPVSVLLRNGGIANLSAAQIVWSVNGVSQDPFAWAGTLAHNAVAEVTIGTFDFTNVGTYYIVATVEVSGDQVTTNNTATRTVTVAAPFGIPYAETFDAITPPELPPLWTISNVNGDNIQWVTSSVNPYSGVNSASIGYNLLVGMNDWLFTPKISLEAGKTYRVSFYYRAHANTHPERLKLHWGTEATVAAMSALPLVNLPSITNTTYAEAQANITPNSTGTYHLGFHGYSTANQWALYIDNVSIDLLRHPVTFGVVGDNGTLSAMVDGEPIVSDQLVAHGSTVVFTATPDANYRVKEWLVNSAQAGHTDTSLTIDNLTAPTTVTVAFEPITNVAELERLLPIAYPNPFSNHISISNPLAVSRVVVTNLVGRVVLDVQTDGCSTIETSSLSCGIYLVTFEAATGERRVHKMVKK